MFIYYLKRTIKSEKNKNIDYLIVEAINYEYYFTTDRFEDDPEDDFETQAFRIIYVFKDDSFCNSYKGIFYRENKDGSFNSQIGYIGRPSFEDDKEKQSTMALIKKIKKSMTF